MDILLIAEGGEYIGTLMILGTEISRLLVGNTCIRQTDEVDAGCQTFEERGEQFLIRGYADTGELDDVLGTE